MTRPMPPTLPAGDFNAIAVDMRLFAEREAFGLEALEVLAAKLTSLGGSSAIAQTVADTKGAAETAARLSACFKALAPFEPEIRGFLEGLLERAGGANVSCLPAKAA